MEELEEATPLQLKAILEEAKIQDQLDRFCDLYRFHYENNNSPTREYYLQKFGKLMDRENKRLKFVLFIKCTRSIPQQLPEETTVEEPFGIEETEESPDYESIPSFLFEEKEVSKTGVTSIHFAVDEENDDSTNDMRFSFTEIAKTELHGFDRKNGIRWGEFFTIPLNSARNIFDRGKQFKAITKNSNSAICESLFRYNFDKFFEDNIQEWICEHGYWLYSWFQDSIVYLLPTDVVVNTDRKMFDKMSHEDIVSWMNLFTCFSMRFVSTRLLFDRGRRNIIASTTSMQLVLQFVFGVNYQWKLEFTDLIAVKPIKLPKLVFVYWSSMVLRIVQKKHAIEKVEDEMGTLQAILGGISRRATTYHLCSTRQLRTFMCSFGVSYVPDSISSSPKIQTVLSPDDGFTKLHYYSLMLVLTIARSCFTLLQITQVYTSIIRLHTPMPIIWNSVSISVVLHHRTPKATFTTVSISFNPFCMRSLLHNLLPTSALYVKFIIGATEMTVYLQNFVIRLLTWCSAPPEHHSGDLLRLHLFSTVLRGVKNVSWVSMGSTASVCSVVHWYYSTKQSTVFDRGKKWRLRVSPTIASSWAEFLMPIVLVPLLTVRDAFQMELVWDIPLRWNFTANARFSCVQVRILVQLLETFVTSWWLVGKYLRTNIRNRPSAYTGLLAGTVFTKGCLYKRLFCPSNTQLWSTDIYSSYGTVREVGRKLYLSKVKTDAAKDVPVGTVQDENHEANALLYMLSGQETVQFGVRVFTGLAWKLISTMPLQLITSYYFSFSLMEEVIAVYFQTRILFYFSIILEDKDVLKHSMQCNRK